jgi:hypothetical protein
MTEYYIYEGGLVLCVNSQLYKYSLSQWVEAYMLLFNNMNKVKNVCCYSSFACYHHSSLRYYFIFTLKLVARCVFRLYKFNIITSLYREMEEACNMSFEACFICEKVH